MVVCRVAVVLVFVAACAHHNPHNGDDQQDAPLGFTDACVGLRCFQVDCESKGLPPTTITGTVFAPNGTLPLFGVNVYVPEADPGPLVDGATCSRCTDGLQGGSLVSVVTDEQGHFELTNVPATANVPVVIQVGKWRRQLSIPNVAACQTLPMDTADATLPKSMTDMTVNTTSVDMPRIAMSTGGADAIECLLRKLGIADTEFTISTKGGRVRMYTDLGIPRNTCDKGTNVGQPCTSNAQCTGGGNPKCNGGSRGSDRFSSTWAGGANDLFTDSQAMWASVDALKKYDIVLLSCEGGQFPASKPQTAMQALSDYTDLGGRVFMSHWHNIWIGGEQNNASHGIASWEATANWTFAGNPNPDTLVATIDQVGNPKGVQFAKWMDNVGGSLVVNTVQQHGLLPVEQSRNTASVVKGDTESWVYLDPATSGELLLPADQHMVSGAMNFQFTTPQSATADQRCGKVVFSDMHVSADSGSTAGFAYPTQCSSAALTAQEKALAFMLFDISSCVGSIF